MSQKETCPIQECNITIINKFIECPSCKFKACLNCYKYSMINGNRSECMNCRKRWNDDFIDSVFPKSFRKKDLKTHQENIMFEVQEAMFTETLDLLNRKKEADKLRKEIYNLTVLIEKYKHDIYVLENMHRENFVAPTADIFESVGQIKKERVFITRPCPLEKCQGYLDKEYTCSACKLVLCSDCEVIKVNDEHKCNKDDVESVKLKNKTSKPCPKCTKLTFKNGGCSQVWCPPPCGTAWNFNTGEIENGPVHSPDYYDYMRKHNNGVVPVQVLIPRCNNNLPSIWDLQRRIKHEEFLALSEIHRFFTHVKNNVMYKYGDQNNVNPFEKNLDIRTKFLENKMDKESFKKTLFSRNKRINKHKTIYQNLDMLYNVGVDIFNKLKYDPQPTNRETGLIDTASTFNELENIRNYYNEVIIKTKERYDSKSLDVSNITEKWVFSH